MKYTKPQVTGAANASLAIMGVAKNNPILNDGNPLFGTNPAYSADE
jgi:hypothetical protein